MNYKSSDKQFDRAILIGVVVLCVSFGLALVTSTSLIQYIDIKSIFLVLGGTVAAVLINFSYSDIVHAIEVVRSAIAEKEDYSLHRIEQIIKLSTIVKSGGILSLEGSTRHIPDPFFRRALELAIDGEKQPELERTLVHECLVGEERAKRAAMVFEAAGTYAPGLGLIGTIFGLVEMLRTVGTGAPLGPSMAVALLTTLYGAVLSNVIFLPLAGKIRLRGEAETRMKRITLEGVRLLQAQENPFIVEQKLRAFTSAA